MTADDIARASFAFLPTILVALIFVTMSLVDVPTVALQQFAANMSFSLHLRPLSEMQPPPPPPPMPQTFLFVGRLRCRPGGAPQLMKLLEPLADAVERSEPHTLTYQVLRSDRNSDELLLLERYRSRADMLEPHKSSPAFLEFKRQLALSGVVEEKSGSSWLSTEVGFASRDASATARTRGGGRAWRYSNGTWSRRQRRRRGLLV